mmetsp:Transcript_126312/g.252374  ORF Transcript_126312/g.252374 Transcript_126312/m.252374 type:complete len:377 (+) Transcript_126312:80-1210(+)|eukprot:CAMPEP_0172664378 /NCGR_PEP_ID=MMETSP1074-20121228/6552_1 /TAXON_ID=2916 /ORGANISM="Ceratium fusus, Strain PA161109" /LENGTH=376 /DNA_ID=CAMNT_0013480511 /DNA_START=82 /DNA_END=1212 /DNA_ORIENTATION=-
MESFERLTRLRSPQSPAAHPTPLLLEPGFEPSFGPMTPWRCGHCSGFRGTLSGQGLHAECHFNTNSRLLLLASGAGLLVGLITGAFLNRDSVVKGASLGALLGTALGYAAGHITLCIRKRQAAHSEPSSRPREVDESQRVLLSTAIDNEPFLSAVRMPERGQHSGTSQPSEGLTLQSGPAGAGRWQHAADQHATNSAAIRTALIQHLAAHRNGRFHHLELQDEPEEQATDHQFALQQQHSVAMMRNTAWQQLSTRQQRLAHRLERAQEERDIRLAQALSLQASLHEPPRARPADPFLVEALPLRRVTAADLGQIPDEHRSCAICLEEFRTGDQQRTLPCFHRFHKACVDQWLRQDNTCPLCKHALEAAVSLGEPSA